MPQYMMSGTQYLNAETIFTQGKYSPKHCLKVTRIGCKERRNPNNMVHLLFRKNYEEDDASTDEV